MIIPPSDKYMSTPYWAKQGFYVETTYADPKNSPFKDDGFNFLTQAIEIEAANEQKYMTILSKKLGSKIAINDNNWKAFILIINTMFDKAITQLRKEVKAGGPTEKDFFDVIVSKTQEMNEEITEEQKQALEKQKQVVLNTCEEILEKNRKIYEDGQEKYFEELAKQMGAIVEGEITKRTIAVGNSALNDTIPNLKRGLHFKNKTVANDFFTKILGSTLKDLNATIGDLYDFAKVKTKDIEKDLGKKRRELLRNTYKYKKDLVTNRYERDPVTNEYIKIERTPFEQAVYEFFASDSKNASAERNNFVAGHDFFEFLHGRKMKRKKDKNLTNEQLEELEKNDANVMEGIEIFKRSVDKARNELKREAMRGRKGGFQFFLKNADLAEIRSLRISAIDCVSALVSGPQLKKADIFVNVMGPTKGKDPFTKIKANLRPRLEKAFATKFVADGEEIISNKNGGFNAKAESKVITDAFDELTAGLNEKKKKEFFKSYLGIEISTKTFDKEGLYNTMGLSGGKLGSSGRVDEVIKNLNYIFKAYNNNNTLNQEEAKAVLVNSVKGFYLQGSLDNFVKYLTTAATLCMFSSGELLAQQIASSIEPNSSPDIIHLFDIGGSYVPMSYILQSLRQKVNDLNANVRNNNNAASTRLGISNPEATNAAKEDEYPIFVYKDFASDTVVSLEFEVEMEAYLKEIEGFLG